MTAAKGLWLDQIRLDGGAQIRERLNQATIEEYSKNIDRLPRVDVFYDGKDYWLADGFHRFHAHRFAGKKEILCSIHQGTKRKAVWFSVGANTAHGLPRTNEDKRRAVETLLRDPEWSNLSDRQIAEHVAVGHPLVAEIRAELKQQEPVGRTSNCEPNSAKSGRRQGKDGKSYPATKKKPPVRRPDPKVSARNEKIGALLATGLSVTDTAKELGCSLNMVQQAKDRLGLRKKKGPLQTLLDYAHEFDDALKDQIVVGEIKWTQASVEEVTQTIEALEALKRTAQKVIRQLQRNQK